MKGNRERQESMGMFEAVATWDWVTPVTRTIKQAIKGGVQFYFPYPSVPSKVIEKLLHQNDVETWGAMVIGDTIYIYIGMNDVDVAEAVLRREGITYWR